MSTNVISLLQLVDEGWEMITKTNNGKKQIEVFKNNIKFTFHEGDRKNLCFLKAEIIDHKFVGNVMDANPHAGNNAKDNHHKELSQWPYDDFHDKFGHHGDDKLRLIAQHMGCKLSGSPSNCDACNMIKSKAKDIPKTSKTTITKVGEKVGLDITGPFPLTSGQNHRSINQKLH